MATDVEAPAEEIFEPYEIGDGWLVVHFQPEQRIVLSETQGRGQVIPASYRAEKVVNGQLVSVEAETEESLEERIASIDEAETPEPEPQPLTEPEPPLGPAVIEEDGNPQEQEESDDQTETVITEEGRFNEADWASRSKTDTVVDEDGQHVYAGADEEIETALASKTEVSANLENEATAQLAVDTAQIFYSTAESVDSPGQSAGGNIVVPEGIETLEEASIAQNEISQAAENERVTDAADPPEEIAYKAPPPDDVDATNGALEAAAELNVDLSEVEGTGKDGKITKADVEQHADSSGD